MTDLNKKPSYMFPNEKRYGRAVPPKRKLNQQVFNVSSSRCITFKSPCLEGYRWKKSCTI